MSLLRCQNETGSKLGGRGDSAVSKVTTDSGVVMENRGIPVLPEAASDVLPARTSESIGESEVDRVTQHGMSVSPKQLEWNRPHHSAERKTYILKWFYF